MEKKNEQNCEPCEQKFEKKVGTTADHAENYSAKDHEKRSTELKDTFGNPEHGSTEHGKEHESSSIHNTSGNQPQKPES